MLKKTMLIAGVVAALTAVVLPAMANAAARNWQHNGKALEKTVEVITHGTAAFTSEQGGVSCPTTAVATLHPGSTGTISSFGASPTSGCTYSGSLDTLCGEVNLHQSTTTGGGAISKQDPWIIHATKWPAPGNQYGFTVTDIEIHVDGTGIFCPNVTTHGDVTATAHPSPQNPHTSTFILEGTMTSNITEVVHVSGTQEVTPHGTYTIET